MSPDPASDWKPEGPAALSPAPDTPSSWHPERPEGWERGGGATATVVAPDGELVRRRRRRKRRSRSRVRGRSSRTRDAGPGPPAAPSGEPVLEEDRPSAGLERPGPSHRRRRRSARARRRRRMRIALYSLFGLAAVLAAISLIPGVLAGSALERGRDALEDGKRALLGRQDATRAAESFAVAQSSFRDARGYADDPLLRLAGLVPIFGRTPDAVAHLARAGERIAVAGSSLSQGLSQLPGGIPALAPKGGRIPIDAMKSLAPEVARARGEFEASVAEIRGIKTSLLVPPLSEATELVRAEVTDALRSVRAADAILGGLPELAGVDGVRRYMVAAENPAELRGTGGIIGMHSIMTISGGRIRLGSFEDKFPPDLAPGAVDPPPGLDRPYTSFGGAFKWLNTNAVPDARTAAQLIERLWKEAKGQRLDGVFFVTPHALSSLLAALGPVEVPRLGVTVSSKNVVDFTTNGAFFLFDKRQALRNRAMGLVAEEVLGRFFQANHPKAALEGLVDAASTGSIIVHAAAPELQRGFEEAGITGPFGPAGGDFFGVVANNIAQNKVDYYVGRSIDYSVTLQPNGAATADVAVGFENTAPTQTGYNEALGPFPFRRFSDDAVVLRSGEQFSYLSFYCAAACRAAPAGSEGESLALQSFPQGDTHLYATSLRLRSRQSRTFELSLSTPRAWVGDGVAGTYRLRLQGQLTIQPTTARVVVRLPPGMRLVSTNVPMDLTEGNELVWQGELGRVEDLEVRFERPLLDTVWVRTRDFLSQPVFHIGSTG